MLFFAQLSPKCTGRCRKFEKSKISCILEKASVLYIICSKCKNGDEKIFKEEESIDFWFNWKHIITLKDTIEENISQEFRLKNLDEIKNCFIEEIKQNEF